MKGSLLFLIIVALLATSYFFVEPSITGHASVSYFAKDVNLEMGKDKNYYVQFDEGIPITSIMASGEVIGEGRANIFLEKDGKRHLIYSNMKRVNQNQITGMFTVENVDIVEEELDVLVEDYEPIGILSGEYYYENRFENACVDTCYLKDVNEKQLKLSFDIEDGVLLRLDRITFSLAEE